MIVQINWGAVGADKNAYINWFLHHDLLCDTKFSCPDFFTRPDLKFPRCRFANHEAMFARGYLVLADVPELENWL